MLKCRLISERTVLNNVHLKKCLVQRRFLITITIITNYVINSLALNSAARPDGNKPVYPRNKQNFAFWKDDLCKILNTETTQRNTSNTNIFITYNGTSCTLFIFFGTIPFKVIICI